MEINVQVSATVRMVAKKNEGGVVELTMEGVAPYAPRPRR